MEMKKIQLRKSLKFLTLLLTAMIIATASATVYFGLTMKATVTTTAVPVVQFVAGDDSGSSAADALIASDGTWVSLNGLKAYPNVTLTYEQAVNVSNTDGSAHNIRLRHSSISPSSGWALTNFTSITFKLVNAAGATVETYAYTVSGTGASSTWTTPSSTTYYSLPNNTEWAIRVEIVTKPSATPSVAINIEMLLDVQQ